MTFGQLNAGSSDAGSSGGEDPRNIALQQAEGLLEQNSEASIEMHEVEGLSLGRVVTRRFLRHRAAMICLAILVIVVLLAFTSQGIDAFGVHIHGWWMWTYAQVPDVIDGGQPTFSLVPFNIGIHPLGQDTVGHDMFAQVMRGTQQSLMIVFLAGIVSTFIGVTLGAVAGYFGGWIDSLLMRLTDITLIVPLYLIAAIVGQAVGGGGSAFLGIFLGVLVWPTLARLVRGEVLALREREFVEAAKVAGASDTRIIFRHILPNTVGVIVVSATLTMSATILTEAAISFLGFGVRSPDTSLGLIISEYQAAFSTRPWLFWWPGLFIVIIALTINFIGDGLRDAFDPRQRRGLNRRARREREIEQATARAAGNAS